MIELAQDNDTMTDDHYVVEQTAVEQTAVEPQTPNVPITQAKLKTLYAAGMQLAHAMRQVGEAECANDLEIWVLGMKHELEAFMEG